MRKFVYVLRRRPDLSREEFQRYWREVHGPLVAKYADTIGLLRYVQVHTLLEAQARADEVRGQMADTFDGVAELWFDDSALSGAQSEEAARAGQELLDDERKFIDLRRSPIWFGNEWQVV